MNSLRTVHLIESANTLSFSSWLSKRIVKGRNRTLGPDHRFSYEGTLHELGYDSPLFFLFFFLVLPFSLSLSLSFCVSFFSFFFFCSREISNMREVSDIQLRLSSSRTVKLFLTITSISWFCFAQTFVYCTVCGLISTYKQHHTSNHIESQPSWQGHMFVSFAYLLIAHNSCV